MDAQNFRVKVIERLQEVHDTIVDADEIKLCLGKKINYILKSVNRVYSLFQERVNNDIPKFNVESEDYYTEFTRWLTLIIEYCDNIL
jgi:hypothetical protein